MIFNDFHLICLSTFSSKQTPELSVSYILVPGSDLILPPVTSAERILSIDPVPETIRPPLLLFAVACLARVGAVGVEPDCPVNVVYPARWSILPLPPPVAESGLLFNYCKTLSNCQWVYYSYAIQRHVLINQQVHSIFSFIAVFWHFLDHLIARLVNDQTER